MKSAHAISTNGRWRGGLRRAVRCAAHALRLRAWRRIGMGALLCLAAALASAQDAEDAEDEEELQPAKAPVELMDREPFDQLTLTAANGNVVVDILPLETPPVNLQSTDRLRVRLVKYPDQEYEVTWENVASYRSYHQLVFDEAQRLVREKKYSAAFRNFDYLLKNTQRTPSLNTAVLEYLLENADLLLSEGKIDHALVVLEELSQRDRHFRSDEVGRKLSQVADLLINQEVERGDYAAARQIMASLDSRYGADRIATLTSWRQRFTQEAEDLKRQAEAKMAADETLREAEQLSRRMVAIWPDLPGAQALRGEVVRRYPMVIVGVSESAGYQDAASIESWPARRTGRLTQRTLLEFAGAGPEGGKYVCAYGEYVQSDDRRRLTLELNPPAEPAGPAALDGYAVARRVTQMADPRSDLYQPAWAALAERVCVRDVWRVDIDLRRPHVLPEAMLQIQLTTTASDPSVMEPGDGPFLRAPGNGPDRHFVAHPACKFAYDNHPREIVERHFASSDEALGALRRGDIDIVDFLLPDEATRLAGDKTVRVVPYALPTIHLLVPNHRTVFTSNQTFRRALLYGINRQAILETEILGNQKVPGYQVISGPFPVGTRDNDPLAYAYDQRVAARSYNPRLASILNTLARRELTEKADKRGESVPPETRIVLGFPDSQLARITCQAISQYLSVIGITCELRELPPDADAATLDELDLVYRQVAMWEPVVDARRLLAPRGVAEVGNEYVGMALRRLDAAKNWREVRERLHDLHRIVDEQVAIIPLWQTVNYLVHSRRVDGVGQRPLTLYQDVEQWQVAPPDGQGSSE